MSSLRAGGLVVLLGAGTACLPFLACAPEDVVVANLRFHEGGADSRPFGTPCLTNDDCAASSFCERADCADTSGVCQVRPTFCDESLAPVCACDGVTFWNDCLRRSRGETSATSGQCSSAPADCGGPAQKPCPLSGASCARLVPQDARCDGPAKSQPDGVCWVLPLACPPPDPLIADPKWALCGPPMPPGKGDCLGTCDAIRSELPHRALGSAVCPP